MTDNKIKRIEGGVTYPQGFQASGIHCGLRKNKTKKDLALLLADKKCNTAAIYTTNKVFGAPITVTREHLKDGLAQAVISVSYTHLDVYKRQHKTGLQFKFSTA